MTAICGDAELSASKTLSAHGRGRLRLYYDGLVCSCTHFGFKICTTLFWTCRLEAAAQDRASSQICQSEQLLVSGSEGSLCTSCHGYEYFVLLEGFNSCRVLQVLKITGLGSTDARWLSICLQLRLGSQGPGIESHIGLPAGSLPLLLPVSLPLSLSPMNK